VGLGLMTAAAGAFLIDDWPFFHFQQSRLNTSRQISSSLIICIDI